jgi:copper chaperone
VIQTTTLTVAGMTCGACVRHVTRALEGMTGVVHVEVDLQTNVVIVEHLSDHVDAMALAAAVRDAGYPARIHQTVLDTDDAGSQPDQTDACGCGCCASTSKRTPAWTNLGVGTIG